LGISILEKSTYSALTGEKVKTNKKEARDNNNTCGNCKRST
jgi:hypothetical protein